MKRNVKNDKVLKAMTIGLAAMIAATSMPMNVYADGETTTESEGGSGSESGESGESSSSEESSSESQGETMEISAMDSAVDNLVEITEPVAAGETAPEENIPAALDTAIAEVGELTEAGVDATVVDGIVADITVAKVGEVKEGETVESGGIVQVNASLEEAQQILNTAVTNESNSSTSVNAATETANEKITTLESKIEECQNKEAELAKTAPNTKAELVSLDNLYIEVQNAYSDAEQAYSEAKGKYEAAVEDMDNLKADIDSAYKNATAAHEVLKAAQQKVNALAEDANKIKDIQEQYYEMLVHFYRVGFGKIDQSDMTQDEKNELSKKKAAAFDENGKLNIDACIDIFKTYNVKIADAKDEPVLDENGKPVVDEEGNPVTTHKDKEVQNLLEYMAYNPGGEVFALNRDLTNKIVSYMLEKKGYTDVKVGVKETEKLGKSIIGKNESQSNKQAVEGVLFTNSEWIDKKAGKRGKDQVVVNSTTTKDINGNIITPNAKYDFWVTSDALDDWGRMNRIKVTYKDENGVEQKAYYNYVLKSATWGDNLDDFANGPIYLAQISKNADGNWVSSRDESENNYINYAKLTEKMQELAPYFEAQAAVDAAEKKVADLEDALARLSKANLGTEVLQGLKNRLDEAKKYLDEMVQRKEEIEEQIESMPDPVSEDDDDSSDSSSSSDTTDGVVFDAGTGTLSLPGLGIPSITVPTSPTSGVAGVRTNGSGRGVAGVKVASNASNTLKDADKKIDQLKETKDKKYNPNQNYKKIENNLIPLAATPFEDPNGMSWWWIVIVVLLGATGKKMYDRHQEKLMLAEAAAESAEDSNDK